VHAGLGPASFSGTFRLASGPAAQSPRPGAFRREGRGMTTITTVEVERELILETATTLEFIGELVNRFVGGGRNGELYELADQTAFELVMEGLGRRIEELIPIDKPGGGESLNEWAEVEARVEKRMEAWS
jgi:hypothetical protein